MPQHTYRVSIFLHSAAAVVTASHIDCVVFAFRRALLVHTDTISCAVASVLDVNAFRRLHAVRHASSLRRASVRSATPAPKGFTRHNAFRAHYGPFAFRYYETLPFPFGHDETSTSGPGCDRNQTYRYETAPEPAPSLCLHRPN